MIQAALPHLKQGSSIINCTSVTMYKGSPQLLDYSATKGAITALTRSLSKAVIDKGIRVNAVAPGPIWTPLNPFGGQKPEDIPEFGKDTPMGRPGPAQRGRAVLPVPRLRGQQLHDRAGAPPQWRRPHLELVGKFSQPLGPGSRSLAPSEHSASLKTHDFFNWHGPCIEWWGGPIVGLVKKGTDTMFATFQPSRTTATSLAAAFISAMLMVSTATSLIA